MKISELPQEIKEKALEYQRNDTRDKTTDCLGDAFTWDKTKEGYKYWYDWDNKEPTNKTVQYEIGIDTFARSEANLTKDEILAVCKFNIDKYNWRKKGQDKQDFEKIIDYANWAIKNL